MKDSKKREKKQSMLEKGQKASARSVCAYFRAKQLAFSCARLKRATPTREIFLQNRRKRTPINESNNDCPSVTHFFGFAVS